MAKTELTENEYERFEKLSARIRNVGCSKMASDQGKELMSEIEFHMGRAADRIDYKLAQYDGR